MIPLAQYNMSSQASQGSEKNKNLLAAKASLGLSTAASSTSSSYRRNPVKSTSIHSVSSSVSGSTYSNESSRKFPASAQEEARIFSSNLRDSGHKSRNQNRLPTSQQLASATYDKDTIEAGSTDDSKADSSNRFGHSSGSASKKSEKSNLSAASAGKKSIRSSNSKSGGIQKTSDRKSNSSILTSESDSELSSSFDNCYENKIDYSDRAGAASLQSIKEEANPMLHDSNANMSERSDLYDSNNNLSQRSDFYDSNTNFSERSDLDDSNTNLSQSQASGLYDSNANLSERSDLYDSNTNLSERSDLYDSNANLSQSQGSGLYDSNSNFSQRSDLYDSNPNMSQRSADNTSQRSREDFVPQRFDEMRTLLSVITPLQLEALMQEIFGNDGPPGWRFKRRKSKRGFRKDAYLSEMSLEELQNFARGMDNLGLDYCTSNEEALDLIAIEFERLVTLHQNKDDQSSHASSVQHQSSVKSNSVAPFEDDQMTLESGRTSRSDEGDNLRRSLRACSFPELRLVAERLRLDHSACVTKGELICMIENSMPDLVDSSTQGSQSQSLLEDYNIYSQPTQQQQQSRKGGERRRKVREQGRRRVKFSDDTKEDKSHLVSKQRGNLGDGQDFESAPLVSTNGDKGSSKFSVVRKHIWKIVVVLLLLVLIIGLSAGLTGRKGKVSNDRNEGSPYVLLPQNGHLFSDFYASSRTSAPSPSTSDGDSEPTSHNQGQPSSGGVFVTNRKPTTQPSVSPTTELGPTYTPTQTQTDTIVPTPMPTGTGPIETQKPSPIPKFSITTPEPTPLSPFPLHGPFEETGMRMVVYGISGLTQMGQTQFKMLTAAYVEQFYNEEGRGTDAIQNIVFDVAASIDITNVEPPPTRRRELRTRSLQSDILVITFTMNLSYRSFSDAVDAKTVSERPFLEESMHADYIQFLRDNNAAKFVGNIYDVTSIFRGDDFPAINYTPAEEDTTVETNSPSRTPVAAVTPRPTLEATPEVTPAFKPTPLTTSPPSLSPVFPTLPPTNSYNPTPSPTTGSSNPPTLLPTNPQTNKPTPGKVIHTYSPVKQVKYTFSPVAYRRGE